MKAQSIYTTIHHCLVKVPVGNSCCVGSGVEWRLELWKECDNFINLKIIIEKYVVVVVVITLLYVLNTYLLNVGVPSQARLNCQPKSQNYFSTT